MTGDFFQLLGSLYRILKIYFHNVKHSKIKSLIQAHT